MVAIDIKVFSGEVTPNGVGLYKSKPLPHTVAIIPVPLIASNAAFKSPNIPADDTCSSAVEDVASGRTAATLALDIIV